MSEWAARLVRASNDGTALYRIHIGDESLIGGFPTNHRVHALPMWPVNRTAFRIEMRTWPWLARVGDMVKEAFPTAIVEDDRVFFTDADMVLIRLRAA